MSRVFNRRHVNTCYNCQYGGLPQGLALFQEGIRCRNMKMLRSLNEVLVYVSLFEKCDLWERREEANFNLFNADGQARSAMDTVRGLGECQQRLSQLLEEH